MGGGSWNIGAYEARVTAKAAAGKSAFDYDDDLRALPYSSWTVHEDVDPAKLNTLGRNVREALDSAEHPNATPIAVIFDVTGSMHSIPRVLQQKLPQLHGLLQRKGYVEDPQILFGGIGDAYSDMLPLQIGQFESDDRGDAQLEHMALEGGGGGGNHESYELAAYYLARHAELDCLKRGKKGYLFIIGDERVYARVDRHQVEKLIGDKLQEDISTAEIFKELQQKFEVFFLFAAEGSYQPGDVLDTKLAHDDWYAHDRKSVCYWRDLLGQNALILEDASAVCETIALTLGVMEGTISLDEGMDDLRSAGANLKAITAAGKALATVGGKSATVKSEGSLPDLPDDESGTTRL